MSDKSELILNSALHLFITKGFHNTPTSLIAKEAGVATGTLFHYFKTKKDLINSLYLKCKDSMVFSIINEIEEKKSIKELFINGSKNLIYWGINNHEKFLFIQKFANSSFINNLTKKEGFKKVDFIYDLIEKGKEQNLIKDFDTSLLVDIISGLITSIILHLLANKDKLHDEKYLNSLSSILWDSIKK
jgi:AcrR family transcriptional regulator